ncbi:MAG: DcaP family trimeric outer membrane transporter [Clostridium sp.]|nr:DcaP family trimeric outer membrane transporter [Prevotella sp.]MCM1429275.1 DcaP family trimeric outer membrane transporter [Clostridium sp.]MCM1475692.1 DcaP family trimeric outer membrane transporter [Muribaculaceae bacterium]
MNLRTFAIISAFLGGASLLANAQAIAVVGDTVGLGGYPEVQAHKQLLDDTKVIFINSEGGTPQIDSVRSMVNTFYMNQFRHFQDPRAPYFMFMSKNANLAMGIGGVIRMRGWFDWNNAVPANGFAPIAMPIPRDPTQKRQFKATPAGTGLFMTIMGRNTPLGNYMGYIEGNFDGYDHIGFKLKKAYFIINDWTVGYATSTFSDPAAEPLTIDGAGASGKVAKTNVLVRYIHTWKDAWSVAGSLEFPQSGIQDDAVLTKKCMDWLPDVAAFGQYQWDGGLSHIRLSGLLRTISYRDLVADKNRNKIGWGISLSGMVKVIKPLTLYGIASYGEGNASYLNDISGSSLDLIEDPVHPGKLYAPNALGLTFGAKYNFKPNIYMSIALSELQYYEKKPKVADDYRYGLYGAASIFWDITPRLQVGAEYLAGKRVNFSGEHTNANRIDALFMFSF